MTNNLSFMDNSTNYLHVMQGANDLTGDMFGGLILLCIAVVMFFAMKRYDTKVSFLVTNFALSVVGLFMFNLGFVSLPIFVIPLILMMGSIFYIMAIK